MSGQTKKDYTKEQIGLHSALLNFIEAAEKAGKSAQEAADDVVNMLSDASRGKINISSNLCQ